MLINSGLCDIIIAANIKQLLERLITKFISIKIYEIMKIEPWL